ncbi:glycoside hydrolase family 6 protein [Botryobasidium botryosum FD-172 SS1]|uniref:Glucanase n=1 Tax=Botryobasidium botryosum (strain FD-172 SS1) TaxID=930990 RepID=A0A067MCM4_BOTB1|nr:glycoside hydrolase family 6 protein [Botryobasidium botryosum FD-172 SS1]
MKFTHALATLALTTGLASAVPAPAAPPAPTTDVNPFVGYDFYVSPQYTDQIESAIVNILKRGDVKLATQAAKVAQVSTFLWISDRASVSSISTYLRDASLKPKKQIVQFVIYDLPDRDCSAKASDGEFHLSNGGEAKYKEYIDAVRKEFQKYPNVKVAALLEPDSIGNHVEKCANAAPAYKSLTAYAISKLGDLPNVSLYLDGAHAGWLGWPGNLAPTADILSGIYKAAQALNPKAKVRGVATNVSNYNGLGNQDQEARDELKYHVALAPLLTAAGFPAHFIVDQGRSGNQVAIREGGDWCNFKNAGFGPRPTTKTPSPLVDAIVWVKPGGQSDGTSDTTSPRYDVACTSATSQIPAPEAGGWFQAYFELLIKQANPAF